jgi:hypothetical protein
MAGKGKICILAIRMEKNPMYGKVLSPEEIARKTARMVSFDWIMRVILF